MGDRNTGAGQMSGAPWHIEVLKKDETDDRRHRSRCIHYKKSNQFCNHYIGRCGGSAHCQYYEERDPEDSKAARSTGKTFKKMSNQRPSLKDIHRKNTPTKSIEASKPMDISFNQALNSINRNNPLF